MIDTRLLKLVRGSGKYIIATAFLQWIQLLSNIVIMSLVAWLLCSFMTGDITHEGSFLFLGGLIAAVVVRALCTMGASKMSYLASSFLAVFCTMMIVIGIKGTQINKIKAEEKLY